MKSSEWAKTTARYVLVVAAVLTSAEYKANAQGNDSVGFLDYRSSSEFQDYLNQMERLFDEVGFSEDDGVDYISSDEYLEYTNRLHSMDSVRLTAEVGITAADVGLKCVYGAALVALATVFDLHPVGFVDSIGRCAGHESGRICRIATGSWPAFKKRKFWCLCCVLL